MHYGRAAYEFVTTAFDLLDQHKVDPNSTYCRGTILINSVEFGEPWYIMRISKKGQLSVIDTRRPMNNRVITHAYSSKSQITQIGKMLSKYLEILQKENGDL